MRMANGDRTLRSQRPVRASASITAAAASERELLEAALRFSAAIMAVVDHTGHVVQLASACDPHEWQGVNLAERLLAAGHQPFERRLEHVLAQGEPTVFEARLVGGGQCAPWYRVSLAPLRRDAALAIVTPIDREREARIENQRFRAIIDQAEEAIFVVDPRTTRFVDVNDTACRMLRYTRAEMLALGPQDIEVDFPLHTRKQWADYIIEVMAVGTLPYEGVHRRKDGTTYPVETTWSIKPFEGDEYLLGVCRDITEQRRIVAELRQAEETMRVSDRLTTVGTLAAGIMHEINNPLSYVMGNLEFTMEHLEELAGHLPEDRADELLAALREANHGAVRMSRIVRDLRTFSRRDEDSVTAVSVHDVLDSSINIAMNEIRQRARIERSYADEVLVMANESRLGQVFLNILINAAQAIPPGDSHNQRITVRTAREGDSGVVIEIRDTGTGMNAEVMARIFDPFFTTKPIGVGTGLGLAICRNIVESLGGRIDVTSQPGAGSAFRIWLPATSQRPARRPDTAPPVLAFRSGRVLIVDDDAHAARALRRHLSHHDGAIETDGRRAMERFLRDPFDAVFCEIRMPDFSGLDFYTVVAERQPELVSRIILVCSGPLEQAIEERLETHGIASTSKPYDAGEVRRLVEERLG
jgi:PAS domain S-box-containing protein